MKMFLAAVVVIFVFFSGCKKEKDLREKYYGTYTGHYTAYNGTQSDAIQQITADENESRIRLFMGGLYADIKFENDSFYIPAQILNWGGNSTTSWGQGQFQGNEITFVINHQLPGSSSVETLGFWGVK